MATNEEKVEKLRRQAEEMAQWAEIRDATTRKRFDYQERWHGWRSPVGLGIGILLLSLSVFLLSFALVNLAM